MYKVKYPLSESSAVRIFLTLAVTPDEDPVIKAFLLSSLNDGVVGSFKSSNLSYFWLY